MTPPIGFQSPLRWQNIVRRPGVPKLNRLTCIAGAFSHRKIYLEIFETLDIIRVWRCCICHFVLPFFHGYSQSKRFIDGSSKYTISGCFKGLGGFFTGQWCEDPVTMTRMALKYLSCKMLLSLYFCQVFPLPYLYT